MDSRVGSSGRGFDLTPAFAITVLIFVAIAMSQFSRSWGDAAQGLLIFERAQKDLYVDADLVLQSKNVAVAEPLAQQLREQTVLVVTRTTRHHEIQGTGVIVGARGNDLAILTARHVVAYAGRRSVMFASHDASIVHRLIIDDKDDLALLWVPAIPGTYTRTRIAKDDFATGDRFVVMGHPGDRVWAATPGIAEHHEHLTLLFCPKCDRGDSGAGAYDMHGVLHGLVTQKLFITAPAAHRDRYVSVTAFSTVRSNRIRAFLSKNHV